MVKLTKVNRKTTKELYLKIYEARIAGNSVSRLMKMYKCSHSTVARAIKWCKNFIFEFPMDDELVKNRLLDIQNRRANFRMQMEALNPSDKCKYNKEIRELDNQTLILLGLIKDRKGNEDLSGKSNAELMRFIEGEKKIIDGQSES